MRYLFLNFALPTIDPNLLAQDAFELELDIRDISKNDPHELKLLCEMLEEEFTGKREPTNKLYSWYRTATSEAAELNWKKSSIVFTTGDMKEIAKCRSRIVHLQGRATRLGKHAEQNVHVKTLQHELAKSLEKCTNSLSASLISREDLGASAVSNTIPSSGVTITNSMDPSDGPSKSSNNWVLPDSYPKPFCDVSLSAQSTDEAINVDKVEPRNVTPPSTSQSKTNQCIEALVRLLAAGNIALPSAHGQAPSIPADPIPPPSSIPSAAPIRTSVQPPPSAYGQGVHPSAVTPQVWAMAKWPLRFSGGPKDR